MAESEKALRRMLDAVGDAAGIVDEASADAIDHAEGYRALTRLMSAAFDIDIENADPDRPWFTRVMTEHRKFFGDNPDALYDYAPVASGRTYRVAGNAGTAIYFAFCAYGGGFTSGTSVVGNVSDAELDVDDDGYFELFIGSEPPDATERFASNWLQIDDSAFAVVLRQYFTGAYAHRREMRPEIDVVGDTAAPAPLADADLATRFEAVGEFVHHAIRLSGFVVAGVSQLPNQVAVNVDPDAASTMAAALFPTPDNHYSGGWFELDSDEALLIEGSPADARYWSVQLLNRWFESFDYVHHRCVLNMDEVVLEPDGTYRIVVAHRDPGVANWLDTAGHAHGIVGFRWMRPTEAVSPPTFTVVHVDEVAGAVAARA